ncbi:MAG: hypothetical protein H0V29_13210 [Thermoleophilaceae bacterium]|nr:hypothetical protein [Thermoleophilaceae bacterium]
MAATLQMKLRPGEPGRETAGRRTRRPRQDDCDGGRLTVEMRISTVWEGLAAAGVADCLMCGGPVEGNAAGGTCSSCGTTIS